MKIALDSEITFFRSEKKRQNCMGVGKCLCGCEIMGRMKSNTLIPEGHSFFFFLSRSEGDLGGAKCLGETLPFYQFPKMSPFSLPALAVSLGVST